MTEKNLVGRCGLYCGACAIFRAERDAPTWRQHIAAKIGTTAEKVCCDGCSALTDGCWGNGCKILICMQTKGYNYCYQCLNFQERTCEMYNDLERRYLKAGENVRENMLVIAEGRIEQWLDAMKRQFTCQVCQNPLAAGFECHHCRKVREG